MSSFDRISVSLAVGINGRRGGRRIIGEISRLEMQTWNHHRFYPVIVFPATKSIDRSLRFAAEIDRLELESLCPKIENTAGDDRVFVIPIFDRLSKNALMHESDARGVVESDRTVSNLSSRSIISIRWLAHRIVVRWNDTATGNKRLPDLTRHQRWNQRDLVSGLRVSGLVLNNCVGTTQTTQIVATRLDLSIPFRVILISLFFPSQNCKI